jgi:hypothetical protein
MEEKAMAKVVSQKRWLLTADKSRAVPDGDPKGAYLLVGDGCEIEAEELEQHGILPDGSGLIQDDPDPNTEDNGALPDDVKPATAKTTKKAKSGK